MLYLSLPLIINVHYRVFNFLHMIFFRNKKTFYIINTVLSLVHVPLTPMTVLYLFLLSLLILFRLPYSRAFPASNKEQQPTHSFAKFLVPAVRDNSGVHLPCTEILHLIFQMFNTSVRNSVSS